ncbi:hypothetical protein [Propylenella binzhouense]|uniref:Uncharacterized protein n=1 Tax=Propylenella binzhouense TaxID=2555902 RepID=A0A964WSU7_9HYPH|nr:hypothetical protein [Propylenella binzhouense]MYZ47343.1 hypothetical protein [Propylenella binzhouense]
MHTPLEVAVTISLLVADARMAGAALDIAARSEEIYGHFEATGYTLEEIRSTLCEEAKAAGVLVN